MSKSKRHKDPEPQAAQPASSFTDLLEPNFLVLCEYALIDQDKCLTLTRLIDQVTVENLPAVLPRLVVVAQFTRLASATREVVRDRSPEVQIVLTTPAGKNLDFGNHPIRDIETEWNVHRLVLDLSDGVQFTSKGRYWFSVLARTDKREFERVLQKSFLIKVRSSREGLVRIFTDELGFVHVVDLSGGDGTAAGISFEPEHVELIEQFLSEIGVVDLTIPKKGKSKTVEATNITNEAFHGYKH